MENVCGAQKWVGRARWHFGSFYLWGDVPALMPLTKASPKVGGLDWNDRTRKGQAFNTITITRARAASIANAQDGRKQAGSGAAWWRGEVGSKSSKSSARKAASAHIAKIPLPLSRHIARMWHPVDQQKGSVRNAQG